MNKRITYLIVFGMVILFTNHSLQTPGTAQKDRLVIVSSGWRKPVKQLVDAYTKAGGPEVQFVKTKTPLQSRQKLLRGVADAMLTFDKYVKYYKSKIYAKEITFLPLLYWKKGVVAHWNQFEFDQGLMVRGHPSQKVMNFVNFVHEKDTNILSKMKHIRLSTTFFKR